MTIYKAAQIHFFSSRKNDAAIEKFIGEYGRNILFVHIPQKDEVFSGKVNIIGEKVSKKIESFGGKIFNGFTECNFEKEDFFVNDGHPTEAGYEKVSNCIRSAIQKNWGL